MSLEIEATYEHGTLKLERPLPLQENERVLINVQRMRGHARGSAGLLTWTGDAKELDRLLAPENHPWDQE